MQIEEMYIKVKADTTEIDELENKINKLSNEAENIAKKLKESIEILHKYNKNNEMLHKCDENKNNICICNTQLRGYLQNIGNTKYTNKDLKLYIKDNGIMISEHNIYLGCFEINYCPTCGRKL